MTQEDDWTKLDAYVEESGFQTRDCGNAVFPRDRSGIKDVVSFPVSYSTWMKLFLRKTL